MPMLLRTAKNAYIEKHYPISVIHFVTNRCNARCGHCFLDFDNLEIYKEELTLLEIEEMSKHLGNSLLNVNLTGGEPFIRKDMFEIVRAYITNAKVQSVFITTNGMFTEKIQEFLDKIEYAGINENIIFSISIDNFEELHDLNRKVKGLYKNAIASYFLIQGYQKRNIMANVAITVSQHNYKNVIDIYNHLKNIGVRAITSTIMREEGIIKSIEPEIKTQILQAYKELTDNIRKDTLKKKIDGYRGMQGALMNAKNMIVNKIIQKTYLQKRFISYCSAGTLFGVIYANGDVYPCEILEDKKLGNVRDFNLNFMALWEDKAAKEFKGWVRDTKCNCTFECAWSINIISDPQFIPELLYYSLKSKL